MADDILTTLPEGYYEFVAAVTATTHVAYVYESGRIYVADADALDFVHATIVHRLVRQDAPQPLEQEAER